MRDVATEPGPSGRPVSFWPAWLVLALVLVATSGAVLALWNSEFERARELFYRQANEGAIRLQRELQLVLTRINGLGYYFASDNPDPLRFRMLAAQLADRTDAIAGLAWMSRDGQECWPAADTRSRQLCTGWERSHPDLLSALQMVSDSGTAELLGDSSAGHNLLMQLVPAGNGAVMGLIDPGAIVQGAEDEILFSKEMSVRIVDQPDRGAPSVLFARESSRGTVARYRYIRSLTTGSGRQLRVEAFPTTGYLLGAVTPTPWVVAAAGLLVSLLGFFYVRGLLEQTARIEAVVTERTRQLDAANRQLAILARLDPLTGLRNRRAFLEDAEMLLSDRERLVPGLALMMIDIDHFKQFNDLYGHRAGDHCLQRVAAAIASCCRGEFDVVTRYGGEEFVVLAPCARDAAVLIANRIRETVAAMAIPHDGGADGGIVTLSGGICWVGPNGTAADLPRWIECADRALYAAKNNGRNRFELLSPGDDMLAAASV